MDKLNSEARRADHLKVAKKKSARSTGAVAEKKNAKKTRKAKGVRTRLIVDDAVTMPDLPALRASVGKGSLAEHVLESLELALGELQRTYGEVAALGKSLALAREQLVEQEDELDALRDPSSS